MVALQILRLHRPWRFGHQGSSIDFEGASLCAFTCASCCIRTNTLSRPQLFAAWRPLWQLSCRGSPAWTMQQVLHKLLQRISPQSPCICERVVLVSCLPTVQFAAKLCRRSAQSEACMIFSRRFTSRGFADQHSMQAMQQSKAAVARKKSYKNQGPQNLDLTQMQVSAIFP